jgi:hypothetical protein
MAEAQQERDRKDARRFGVLFWSGLVMVVAGFSALWIGSTVAAPILIVFGYVALGFGILW